MQTKLNATVREELDNIFFCFCLLCLSAWSGCAWCRQSWMQLSANLQLLFKERIKFLSLASAHCLISMCLIQAKLHGTVRKELHNIFSDCFCLCCVLLSPWSACVWAGVQFDSCLPWLPQYLVMSTSLTHANRLVGWPKHVSLSDARKVEHCMSCLSLRQPRFAFAQCLTILGMMQGKLRGTVKEQLDQILKAVVRIRLETEALHPIHELFVPEATQHVFCPGPANLV